MSVSSKCQGRVMLVGAGPGDPELLTIKALRAVQSADVVVYDRLVSDAILALVPDGVARIDVGKQPQHHPVPQDEINRMLVRLARSGRTVVRLKGGDPFVFGRGGEEAMELAKAGIACSIIPGITSAQGCLASLGIPLTHRGLATGIRLVTGHCRAGEPLDVDWAGLADPGTTLVVYMGAASLPVIVGELIAHGLAPDTPALAVSRGTQPDQRHIFASLAALPRQVEVADLPGPILFVIGHVVGLASEMGADSDAPGNAKLALAT